MSFDEFGGSSWMLGWPSLSIELASIPSIVDTVDARGCLPRRGGGELVSGRFASHKNITRLQAGYSVTLVLSQGGLTSGC